MTDDGSRIWSAEVGDHSFTAGDFVREVRSFDARLMAAMRQLVDDVVARHSGPATAESSARLVQEHSRRERELDRVLRAPTTRSAWDAVRQAIGTLGQ